MVIPVETEIQNRMKLLLTSSGISNPSIAKALFDLVGKKPEETSLVFIPTASHLEVGDKNWFIDDLVNLKNLHLKCIDIADISAVDEKIWRPKLEAADVLFFEGGNTYHLMRWIKKSGLAALLRELLKTRVYVGVSAGSMVASKDLLLRQSQILYGEDLEETADMTALSLVDFYVLPHLNSEHFSVRKEDVIREAAQGMTAPVYALDDQSALKVVDGEVEAISEGEWFRV